MSKCAMSSNVFVFCPTKFSNIWDILIKNAAASADFGLLRLILMIPHRIELVFHGTVNNFEDSSNADPIPQIFLIPLFENVVMKKCMGLRIYSTFGEFSTYLTTNYLLCTEVIVRLQILAALWVRAGHKGRTCETPPQQQPSRSPPRDTLTEEEEATLHAFLKSDREGPCEVQLHSDWAGPGCSVPLHLRQEP